MSVMAGKAGLFKIAEHTGGVRRAMSVPNLNSRTGCRTDNASPCNAAKARLVVGALKVISWPGARAAASGPSRPEPARRRAMAALERGRQMLRLAEAANQRNFGDGPARRGQEGCCQVQAHSVHCPARRRPCCSLKPPAELPGTQANQARKLCQGNILGHLFPHSVEHLRQHRRT